MSNVSLLSLKQVSEMLGQTTAWVNRACYLKRITYRRFGRIKMFLPEDVAIFQEKCRVEAQGKWSTGDAESKAGGSTIKTTAQESRSREDVKAKGKETQTWKPLTSRLN